MARLALDASPEKVDSSVTVSVETSPRVPSREEIQKVAQRRYQNPEPFQEGNFWWLLIRQDEVVNGKRIRKKKRIKLASVDSYPSRKPGEIPCEIRKLRDDVTRPLNQGLVTIGSATKFDDYVEQEYKVSVLPLFTKRTQERYEGIVRNYLSPEFGQLPLRELTALRIQKYISGFAQSPLSHESKDKIRDVLSSILGSAKNYGLIVLNPVEGVRLPPSKKGKRGKPYVTPEQFHQLIQLIAEPYASMIYVAVYTGLRASELVGLRWKNVHADSITIDERYSAGEWGCPKSDASNATIAVNNSVIERIHRLKTLTVDVRAGQGAVRHYCVVKSDGPEDLVFQLVSRNAPQCPNNALFKHIKPAARSLGIGWVNWQVLRRSHATWLKMAGADVKDAQAQMRHSRASTTLDIYQQFVPASQRQAVDRLTSLSTSGLLN
jgi:integrase